MPYDDPELRNSVLHWLDCLTNDVPCDDLELPASDLNDDSEIPISDLDRDIELRVSDLKDISESSTSEFHDECEFDLNTRFGPTWVNSDEWEMSERRYDHPGPDPRWNFGWYQLYTKEERLRSSNPSSPVLPSFSLDWAYDYIKRWLSKCNKSHGCRVFGATRPPTRVIDVGSADILPRVHTTAGEEARYITLSHRWPSPGSTTKRLVATTHNLTSLCSSIAIEDLPKTFLDAIYVTRALGVQYLWIDCICIIQDDKQDMAREIQDMANIYGNSYLNLSAEWSLHSDGGLLDPEYPARAFNKTRTFRPYKLVDRLECAGREKDSVIADRGWVLQEHLLSGRTVGFGSTELRWHCTQMRLCQCGSSTHYKNDGYNYTPESAQDSFYILLSATQKLTIFSDAMHWNRIIEHFSKRQLTFEKDRLAAIAGIAGKLSFPREDYVAGMWRHWLGETLHWYAETPSSSAVEPSRMPSTYAPSWSWASITMVIRITCDRRDDNAEAEFDFEGNDPITGRPHDSVRLLVRGCLLKCRALKWT